MENAMSWDLTGKRVKGIHNGVEFMGRVIDSRVRYGGAVQLTVKLAAPVQYRWRNDPTDTMLVDATQVTVLPD
jgi:hypothetical protein